MDAGDFRRPKTNISHKRRHSISCLSRGELLDVPILMRTAFERTTSANSLQKKTTHPQAKLAGAFRRSRLIYEPKEPYHNLHRRRRHCRWASSTGSSSTARSTSRSPRSKNIRRPPSSRPLLVPSPGGSDRPAVG